MPPDGDIRAFWAWFADFAPRLAADFGDDRLLEELSTRVESLGASVSWEIGPGTAQPCALTITPDGDPDLLPITKHIVSFAPTVPGWEIHPAKPPKAWTPTFTLQLPDGDVAVDARGWTYVLYKYSDGMIEIVIAAPELAGVAESVRYMAGTILVDGMLGEAVRLEHICAIEVLERLPDERGEKASRIIDLAKHLTQLLPS